MIDKPWAIVARNHLDTQRCVGAFVGVVAIKLLTHARGFYTDNRIGGRIKARGVALKYLKRDSRFFEPSVFRVQRCGDNVLQECPMVR